MKQILFTLPIRGKRGVVRARQRTRQIARLLGFDALDQAALAAAVFAIAENSRGDLVFQLAEDVLQISMGPAARLEKHLPQKAEFSAADLHWMIDELNSHTPLKVFEEMRRQNQELLRALADLRACQLQLAGRELPGIVAA